MLLFSSKAVVNRFMIPPTCVEGQSHFLETVEVDVNALVAKHEPQQAHRNCSGSCEPTFSVSHVSLSVVGRSLSTKKMA